jgi:hypothetical protein
MATDAGVRSVPELRDFGKNLQKMGEQMYGVMTQAQQRMNYVSEGWHDDNNEKFKVRFAESVQMIKKMSEEFRVYNEFLQRQCDVLDQYKGNHLNI